MDKCKHEKLHYQGCGDWYCVECLEYFDQEDANNIVLTNQHHKIESLQARIAELEHELNDARSGTMPLSPEDK